ncbi:hypothetical protein GCM10011414_22430 [Croceivirga lutea]|uniref:hypothetical protein n=1 Tax=Croceivirga lutea TaxID=1775167 RepID=UPI001639C2E5|nr:hypothetical protein [Croceivirga lutea]GGG52385.1 hypothetical protein GCM10011414_22430 [Croceivirga lutea]
MKKFLLLFLIVILLVWACDDRDDNLLGPNVRIQNLSQQNFQLVELEADSIFYENISSEGFSEYLELDEAYFQDTLRIEADSTMIVFTPDSIGDPLPIGLYTYQLKISEEGELIFTFKLD